MSPPLVSIVTPSFNQRPFLADCLKSVANQTYARIEHVVCDGGSSDGSRELLEASGSGVHWVSERDGGQANALNRALRMSEGDIIGWVNSDDGYADRRSVERVVGLFDRHPAVDVVVGSTILIDETNLVLQVQPAIPVRERLLRVNNYVVQPGVFMRRTALPEDGMFLRETFRFVMDRDLWMRLLSTARFLSTRSIIAFDRHQRNRKVETADFPEELKRYDESLGLKSSDFRVATAVALRLGLRVYGALPMLGIARSLDPAIDLRFSSPARRLVHQLAVPRARMGFGAT